MRLLAVLFLLTATLSAQELKFAADRPIDVHHLRLEGRIDLKERTFKGTATLDISTLRALKHIRLDAVALEVKKITVPGIKADQSTELKFTNTGTELLIDLPRELKRGIRFKLKIEYVVEKPEKGLYFFGPTETEPDTPYQVWSQGETLEARYWIPITDQPNERLTSELLITCNAEYQVLSNGALQGVVASGAKDGTHTVHWKQEKDHVPYLITLVVGKFEILKEKWRGKLLTYWVPPDRKADAMRSFANTKRMMDFFSDQLGVEYPWSKYAQVVVEQFTFGGMENTSATTLTERTLHDKRAAIDFSSDGLIAHELAHQWFGDLLTCKDWAHTWLNEGFATYFEALWNEKDKGEDAFRVNMLGKARAAINGGKTKPIVYRKYKGPWEQFDARSYPKGAWVLHMLRRQLGNETWWRAIGWYTKKHAHQVVETSDLRNAIEQATGRNLERFFHDWTARPGHPVVEVTHKWHAARNSIEVIVRQTQKSEAFHFPLELEYVAGGEAVRITQLVTAKRASTFVPLSARPDLVRVDPEFAVLMELTEKKDRDWWLAQLSRDANVVARIRAARHFGKQRRDPARKALGHALRAESRPQVRAEIAKALGSAGGDIARVALRKAVTDADSRVREAVVKALGNLKRETALLAKIATEGDASYKVEAAAIAAWAQDRPDHGVELLLPMLARNSHRESIRQAVLRGLGDQGDVAALKPLLGWTRRGKPRSCRTAALDGLRRLAKHGRLDDAQYALVVAAAQKCLHRLEHRSVKTQATQLLRDLGKQATSAIPALRLLAAHDPNGKVREAATNALIHGNERDSSKLVMVAFGVQKGSIEVEIEDQGTGFNPEQVDDPRDADNVARTSGRGIFLMRSFMDEVTFQKSNSDGMHVRLTKSV
jgi:aminopeptidase N